MDKVHELIADKAAVVGSESVEIYHHLHMYPELSGEEIETGRFIKEKLDAIGISAEDGIGGYGVAGVLHGGKPGAVIAWRADIDACAMQEANDIPYKSRIDGLMHLCGHDAHTAIALGIAEVLYSVKEQLCGDIKFIFQPGEEKSDGAKRMIQDGVLDNPHPCAIYGLHQGGLGSNQKYMEAGQIAINYGTVLYGLDVVDICIAISRENINAWAEQELLISLLKQINGLKLSDKATHNIIDFEILHKENHDEEKHVKITARCRYAKQEYRDRIRNEIARLINLFKDKTGSDVTVEYVKSVPPVYNDEKDCDEAKNVLNMLDGANVVSVLDEVPPHGTDDYSFFQHELSGLFFFLGSANLEKGFRAQNHTPTFRIDENCIPFAVKTMSSFLYEMLKRKEP